MNQKVLPKLGRYSLLLLACALLSGVWFFAPNKSELNDSATPAVQASAQQRVSQGTDPFAEKLLSGAPQTTAADLKKIESAAGEGWYAKAIDQLRKSEYKMRWIEEKGAVMSANRAQNLRATYHADGFSLQPRVNGEEWDTELRVESVAGMKPSSSPEVKTEGNRLEVNHGGFAMEYVNNEAGMRQNFIVNQRPANGNLEVRMNYNGSLKAIQPAANEVAFADANNATRAFYKDLKVWDANNTVLEASMKLNGDQIVIAVNDAQAEYPVTIDPISCSPNWMNSTAQPNAWQTGAQYGFSTAVVGTRTGIVNHLTLNNDGTEAYADIVIGAPYFDNGAAAQAGAVFVYYGAVGGPSTTYNWARLGTQPFSQFGYSVACAGNVYNTGPIAGGNLTGPDYAEIVVGSPLWDGTDDAGGAVVINSGRVFAFAGSASGLPAPVETNLGNSANANLVWSTSRIGTTPYQNALLGFSVAGAGNVGQPGGTAIENNNDDNLGGSDIIAGAPGYSQTDFVNEAADGDATAEAAQANRGLATIYLADAVDGNDPRWPGGAAAFPDNGDQFIITNDHNTPADAATVEPLFGASVACAGPQWEDNNGLNNERDAVLIGSPGYENIVTQQNEGAVYLINTNGRAVAAAGFQMNLPNGELAGDQVGVRGDRGLTISRFQDQTIAGADPTYYRVLEGNQAQGELGFAVAGDFNVNGDDFAGGAGELENMPCPDVAVGMPGFQSSAAEVDEGAVVVFHGDNGGNPDGDIFYDDHAQAQGNNYPWIADFAFQSNQANARLGEAVSGGGNLNGENNANGIADGVTEANFFYPYEELLVGAPFMEGTNGTFKVNEGVVYVFYGSATGLNQGTYCMLEGQRANSLFGRSLAGVKKWHNANGYREQATVDADGIPNTVNIRSFNYDGTAADQTLDYGDVLVGIPGYDRTEFVQTDEGRAYAYYGREGLPNVAVTGNTTFCSGSYPTVQLNVTNLTYSATAAERDTFRFSYLEGTTRKYSRWYRFDDLDAGVLNGQVTITLDTDASVTNNPTYTGPIQFTIDTLYVNECCQFALAPIVQTYTLANQITFTALTNHRICEGAQLSTANPAPNLGVGVGYGIDNIQGLAAASNLTVYWSINGNAQTPVTTTGTVNGNDIVLLAPTTVISDTSVIRVDSILNSTVNCTTVPTVGNQGIVWVADQPEIAYNQIPEFCNNNVALLPLTFTAPVAYQFYVTYRIRGDVNTYTWPASDVNNPVPTTFLTGTGAQATANILLGASTANPAQPEGMPMNADFIVDVQSVTLVNIPDAPGNPNNNLVAVGCTFDYMPDFTRNASLRTNQPTVDFITDTIQYCRNTVPDNAIVDVNNVRNNERWYVVWSENDASININSTLRFVSTGVGPQQFNLTQDSLVPGPEAPLGSFPPGTSVPGPNAYSLDFNYYISHIITADANGAAACTTEYLNPSQLVAEVANTTTPLIQFDPVPAFCPGTSPSITFDITGVPAGEQYKLRGIRTNVATGNSEPFTTDVLTGSANNVALGPLFIGANPVATPLVTQNAGVQYNYQIVGYEEANTTPVCIVPISNVSSSALPGDGGDVMLNLASPNFCPNTQPVLRVSVPAGIWTITYLEISAQFGAVTRSVTINAPVGGNLYPLTTSQLSTNATYTILAATSTSGCPAIIGNSVTAFVSQNALPQVTANGNPQSFCAGSVPSISLNVQNVPATGQNWQIAYRVGSPTAALQFTPVDATTIGPNANYTLPLTVPSTTTETIYIDYIELVGGGCRNTNTVQIIATPNPLPSVRFINAPSSVCGTAQPTLTIQVDNVSVGQSFTLMWSEGGTMRSLTETVTSVPYITTLTPVNAVTGTTTYQLTQITNNNTNCTANPPASPLTTLNLNINSSAAPTAAFSNTNFNFCGGARPQLGVNVTGMGATETWTITYVDVANNTPQVISGVGNPTNFTFFTTLTPTGSTTYEIRSITNNATGCSRTYTGVSATATSTGGTTPVTLNPVSNVCVGDLPAFTVNIPGGGNWTLFWAEDNPTDALPPTINQTTGSGATFTLNPSATLYNAAGNYTVQLLFIQNNTSCAPFVDRVVRSFSVVSGGINADFSATNSYEVCSGSVPVINVDITPAGPYTLTYAVDGTSFTVSGNGGTVNIGGSTAITAATSYSLISVSSSTCSNTFTTNNSVTVNVNAQPNVALNNTNVTFCSGSAPILSANVTNITNGNDMWTLRYREIGGPVQTVMGTGNQPNFTFQPAMAPTANTTYELLTIENNATGCVRALSGVTATATLTTTAGTVTFNTVNNICTGETPAITVNVPVANATDNWTLDWAINGIPQPTVNGAGTSFALPSNPITQAGNYTVSLIGVSAPTLSCPPALGNAVTFTVNETPSAVFSATNPTQLCSGSVANVFVNVTPANSSGTITFMMNGNMMTRTYTNASSVNIGGSVVNANSTWQLMSVTSNGCTANLTNTYALTVTPGISATTTITSQPTGCNNSGAIMANVANRTAAEISGYVLQTTAGVTLNTANGGATMATFSSLAPGQYNIVVNDVNGCSVTLGPVTLVSAGATVPSIITPITAVNTNTVNVNWSAISGGAPYTLEYRPVGATAWFTVPNIMMNSQVVSGLQAGVNYQFRVRSSCDATFSAIETFSTQSPCAANPVTAIPQNVQTGVTNIGNIAKIVTVSWDNVGGAVGYVVSWRVRGGNPTFTNQSLCVSGTNLTFDAATNRYSYTIPGSFLINTTYEVQVRSYCQTCTQGPAAPGTSLPSTIETFRLEGEDAPMAELTHFSVYPNPTDGDFTVSFDAVEDGSVAISMTDMAGRALYNTEYNATTGVNEVPVEVSGFASGVYILTITQGETTRTAKVVLN